MLSEIHFEVSVLFRHSGFQPAYHRTRKSGMLHFVKSAYRHASGRSNFVYLDFRMTAAGLQQVYGSLHRLHHYPLRVMRLESEFNAALCRSPDIPHCIGYAARCKRSGSSEQPLLRNHLQSG